jgi:polyisoprenoid-binding protein YceI
MTTPTPDAAAELVRQADAAGTWTLDPAGSTITFANKTMWGLMNVKGTFGSFDGTVEVHEDGSATATLSIETATIDTKMAKRDTHLKTADFFDVDNHPRIELRAESVRFASATRATVAGTLTVFGQTRPVTVEASTALAADGRSVTVDATVPFERAQFGNTWNQMGMMKPVATVTAHLVFRKA